VLKLIETKFTVGLKDSRELTDIECERHAATLSTIMDDTEIYLRKRIGHAGHLRSDLLTIERTET
jgi:hypothetical protein